MTPTLRQDIVKWAVFETLFLGGLDTFFWFTAPAPQLSNLLLVTALMLPILAFMGWAWVAAREGHRTWVALEPVRRAEAEAREAAHAAAEKQARRERVLSRPERASPLSVEAAVAELRRNVPAAELERWVQQDELQAIGEAHFGLGMWIRNEWLWHNTPLRRVLDPSLERHPDYLSGDLLRALHRSVRANPVGRSET